MLDPCQGRPPSPTFPDLGSPLASAGQEHPWAHLWWEPTPGEQTISLGLATLQVPSLQRSLSFMSFYPLSIKMTK